LSTSDVQTTTITIATQTWRRYQDVSRKNVQYITGRQDF